MRILVTTIGSLTILIHKASGQSAKPGDSLFQKHRTIYHAVGPNNWMNDPCGIMYSEKTDLYHVFYQRNPFSAKYEQTAMTWGHLVSKDQVIWQDLPEAMHPDGALDFKGVFSGQGIPHGVGGKPTAVYTGAVAKPIYFADPYSHGERVTYATSEDNGLKWTKSNVSMIDGSPKDLDVTGWRDPYVLHSASLDKFFNRVDSPEQPSMYMLLSGGIRDEGPSVFLYRGSNYTNWEYEGLLVWEPLLTSFYNESISGKFGVNFEMASMIELEDEGKVYNTLFVGSESRERHYSHWMFLDTSKKSSGKGFFDPLAVGVLDNSVYYAANSFKDPKYGKYIMYAWITEETGYDEQPQGWAGIISLPREISIATVRNILDPLHHLAIKSSWIVDKSELMDCGKDHLPVATIKTLGIKPLEGLSLLRDPESATKVPNIHFQNGGEEVLEARSRSFEIEALVTDFDVGSQIGFKVRSSDANGEFTRIVYDDKTATLTIDRSSSCNMKCSEVTADHKPTSTSNSAYFKAYQLVERMPQGCSIKRESVHFRIFVDVSVIEVFVNDRVALSARIYPCETFEPSDRITAFSSGNAVFQNVKVWKKMKPAFPEERQIDEVPINQRFLRQ